MIDRAAGWLAGMDLSAEGRGGGPDRDPTAGSLAGRTGPSWRKREGTDEWSDDPVSQPAASWAGCYPPGQILLGQSQGPIHYGDLLILSLKPT